MSLPIFIESYYIKWSTTSWADSIKSKIGNHFRKNRRDERERAYSK